jgi:hypothetical protein
VSEQVCLTEQQATEQPADLALVVWKGLDAVLGSWVGTGAWLFFAVPLI